MDHSQLKIILDAILDGEATPEEERIGRDHLAQCQECEQERVFTARFSQALRRDLKPLDASFSVEIMERIRPQRKFVWTDFVRWLIPIPVLASAFLVFNIVRSNEIPSTYAILSDGLTQDSALDSLVLESNPSTDVLVTPSEERLSL